MHEKKQMQQILLRDLKFLLFYSSCLPCSVRDLTNIACFLSPDFVGPGHCTIPCADGHGDYADKFDGTGETEAIDVVFRCYTEESDGNYTAWFGYNNTNDHNVYITSSYENYITKSSTTVYPPTKFTQGWTAYALSVK